MAIRLLDIAVALFVLGWLFVAYLTTRRSNNPPGPPGYPIVGNVLDVPMQNSWIGYRDLGRRYGTDTLFLKLLGMPVLVLNSWTAASELLEKRSSKYSDRPRTVMMHELSGWDRAFFLRDADSTWRTHRRAFHQYFNQNTISQYQSQTAKYTRRLLKRLLDKPENILPYIRWMTGALIIDIAYGFDVQREDDPWLAASEKAMHGLIQMGKAGAYLVDLFPILKYVPGWFPGIKFKDDAAEYRRCIDAMFENPLRAVRGQISAGMGKPSVTSSLLSQLDTDMNQESHGALIESVSGTIFAGGQDTVTSAISSFYLAMVLHPEIQRAAQAELDRVVGHDRLPELTDRESLPMITAIMWEVLRWRPVGPLGVPHKLNMDDEYEGYDIPAGTIVFANIWAILHDETTYPDPEKFDPYRFLTPTGELDKSVPLPDIAIFGFGRRVCPGRFFGLQVMWLNIANLLAAFSFEKRVDETGSVIEPSGEYTHDLIVYPLPFDAEIKPRSKTAEDLVRHAVDSE